MPETPSPARTARRCQQVPGAASRPCKRRCKREREGMRGARPLRERSMASASARIGSTRRRTGSGRSAKLRRDRTRVGASIERALLGDGIAARGSRRPAEPARARERTGKPGGIPSSLTVLNASWRVAHPPPPLETRTGGTSEVRRLRCATRSRLGKEFPDRVDRLRAPNSELDHGTPAPAARVAATPLGREPRRPVDEESIPPASFAGPHRRLSIRSPCGRCGCEFNSIHDSCLRGRRWPDLITGSQGRPTACISA